MIKALHIIIKGNTCVYHIAFHPFVCISFSSTFSSHISISTHGHMFLKKKKKKGGDLDME